MAPRPTQHQQDTNRQGQPQAQTESGGPSSALGSAFAALAFNVVVGVVSGLAATAAASVGGTPRTRAEMAAATKRGLVVGAGLHGAITTTTGLALARRYPHFAGATTYIGVSALSSAAFVAMVPVSSISDRLESDPDLLTGGVMDPPTSGVPTERTGGVAEIETPAVSNPSAGLPAYGGAAMDPMRRSSLLRVRSTPMDAAFGRKTTTRGGWEFDDVSGAGGVRASERNLAPDDIRAVQRTLRGLGHDVACSGVLDVATRNAILAFQRGYAADASRNPKWQPRSLTADGVVGPNTQRALGYYSQFRDRVTC